MHLAGWLTAATFATRAIAQSSPSSPYGTFPQANDAFRFQPCPNTGPFQTLPALNDTRAEQTWAALFNPDPNGWLWGTPKANVTTGIYLCGYLDVPLDYTNKSDSRIVRLAVLKYQVSGLALSGSSNSTAGKKSARTILMNPGGPGGPGVALGAFSAEASTSRLSSGKFDFMTWDPRGVGISLPRPHCLPSEATRDRWSFTTSQELATLESPQSNSLGVTDAYNEAIWRTCFERLGDIGRFFGTAFVVRDLEQIRIALGEDDISGHFVSYGTDIAQTYAAMFPSRVGRMVLDAPTYTPDHRRRAGFGTASLDNVTHSYIDGILGDCVKAGPDYCALAKPVPGGGPVTLSSLKSRMESLLASLAERPFPLYRPNYGPVLVTYSSALDLLQRGVYYPAFWADIASIFADLESGKSPSASQLSLLEANRWVCPSASCASSTSSPAGTPDELMPFVVCADAYDAPEPNDMAWWRSLWVNMTATSFITGDTRFYGAFRCRHFTKFWPQPAEVFRGNLSQPLKNTLLIVAATYDPATPLRNGRRLAAELGRDNARLVVHHGYGHGMDNHPNKCTDAIVKAYVLNGDIPQQDETDCFSEGNPYVTTTLLPAPPPARPRTSCPSRAWSKRWRLFVPVPPALRGPRHSCDG
ncbi:TAP-like protein-domain-containing protein [Cercophora newfieldiana]|uniref:TAP-like protein-domain-containing protein n=1 Tax=Cercophora newfieldiana TaxID=92897 RepID=A0AA39YA46_9PEZI|nr:TAP-like protein-domain-containing protein [Cercophora newfieldiana]